MPFWGPIGALFSIKGIPPPISWHLSDPPILLVTWETSTDMNIEDWWLGKVKMTQQKIKNDEGIIEKNKCLLGLFDNFYLIICLKWLISTLELLSILFSVN